ncbi:MAG: Zn-dependent oligopeptidase [Bdellovibrionales bacterium]|nr:Zn-dependent oligopeptidase [Bdellovibrionales bacterium]
MEISNKVKALITSLCLVSCATHTSREIQSQKTLLIPYNYQPEELKKMCEEQVGLLKTSIDELVKTTAPLSFANSFEKYETLTADIDDRLSPLTFMNDVSVSEPVRKASEECESLYYKASIDVNSRRDLYQFLKKAEKSFKMKDLTAVEKRLVDETMKSFKLSGLELSDKKLAEFKKYMKEISDLNTQFRANLNSNNDAVIMNEQEMTGVPDSVRSLFTKLDSGEYKIPAKAVYYIAFMENASNPEARKKFQSVYDNREATKNTELLQKAVTLRRKEAQLLGFRNWADYKTYDKMAKTGDNAWKFLNSLKTKLRKAYQKDYNKLLAFKQETEPNSKKLSSWDGAYYSNQYVKKYFQIDPELLREYFPTEHVISKMFEIYETLLNVQFSQVANADTWFKGVSLYEVKDKKTNEILAYFFMDLYPREGKYNHAAAFTLRSGREVGGNFLPPISAIVANLTPPTKDKPSLLSHDNVETLFHEFGHIMHISLSRVKYASLSGTRVARDFVEAPSQMLENWVWQPEILKMISQKYNNPTETMPDDLIQKLVASRKFNQAWMNTRQLIFGIYDLTLHRSSKDLDVTKTYKKIYQDLTGMEALSDTHWPAGFGHIMGGYDAGYYGYMWSNVYAFDMFSNFQGKNLLSPDEGLKYRVSVLEKGDTKDASQLLYEFLGRKPSNKAFFDFLGVR